jgi:hypothetical protein
MIRKEVRRPAKAKQTIAFGIKAGFTTFFIRICLTKKHEQMKKSFLFMVAILVSFTAAFSQEIVHQVFFLNEGYYDYFEETQVVTPTLGVYDPETQVYTEVATLGDGRFGSDLVVHNEKVYVAADTRLMVFDANSFALLDEVEVEGIRAVSVWQDQVIVTRGEVYPLDSYLQVYSASALDLLYEFNTTEGPEFPSQDIIIIDDEAFIGVNNGFTWGQEVGLIGILDLENQTYGNEIDLGPNGTNPDNMMFDGETIYTLNNMDFSASSVSSVDVQSAALNSTTDVALNSGCASSALIEGQVNFMEYGVDKVARFDVETEVVVDTLEQSQAYYGMAYDQINGQIFASTTDYVATGEAFILDADHNELASFEVGVSAGSIAFDIREATRVDEGVQSSISVFPNPCNDVVNIGLDSGESTVIVTDLTGKVILSQVVTDTNTLRIDISNWEVGVYVISVNGMNQKLIKA